jgi:metal-dependent amidase/aminoacylase/carboxypeptidase family protein
MLERGAFAGVHAAMMVHPVPAREEIVRTDGIIASSHLQAAYTGRAAHAAAYPWLGLNAADALTVAQVAIGLLRQHFEPGDRVHGVVTLGGGAPNVIPERTAGSFIVRSKTLERLERLERLAWTCIDAATGGIRNRLLRGESAAVDAHGTGGVASPSPSCEHPCRSFAPDRYWNGG